MDRIDPDEHAIDAQELRAHLVGKFLVVHGRHGIDADGFERLEDAVESIVLRCHVVPRRTVAAPDNRNRLLLASGVMAARHMTRAATRAPRRALPRRRALCTNSKKPRYSGSFSCEMPRCGRSQERSKDHVPSIVLTWISQKPSPSSSRAYSLRAWHTVLCR